MKNHFQNERKKDFFFFSERAINFRHQDSYCVILCHHLRTKQKLRTTQSRYFYAREDAPYIKMFICGGEKMYGMEGQKPSWQLQTDYSAWYATVVESSAHFSTFWFWIIQIIYAFIQILFIWKLISAAALYLPIYQINSNTWSKSFFIFTYPLTARIVEAPQLTSLPFFFPSINLKYRKQTNK